MFISWFWLFSFNKKDFKSIRYWSCGALLLTPVGKMEYLRCGSFNRCFPGVNASQKWRWQLPDLESFYLSSSSDEVACHLQVSVHPTLSGWKLHVRMGTRQISKWTRAMRDSSQNVSSVKWIMRNFRYERALWAVARCLERAQFPKQSWTLKLQSVGVPQRC